MLQPARTKYRKQQKGRNTGVATRGNKVSFGEYGLKALTRGRITARQSPMGWEQITLHVLIITVIANIGNMFPAFCYRKEAHWRERVAVSIGMWPRGEVGAGVLVISLSYGIGGPVVTVAMLSLALNLLLSGFFIYLVKHLTASLPAYGQGEGK